MPTYTVIPQADQTFHVAIVGFQTEADAEAWITRDRRQSAVGEPSASR